MQMGTRFGDAETEAQARSRYLKEMMHIRKVTADDLSLMTGISRRTLERYISGRTDPADAAGMTIAKICYALSMNVYTLGGAESIKPGTAFKSDGRQAVVKPAAILLYREGHVRDAFKWAMDYNKLTQKDLAEKACVKERVIYDMLSYKTDIRRMKARTIFRLCRLLIFHPYFLYGFRDMKEYGSYIRSYRTNLKKKREQEEIQAEAERIYRKRKTDNNGKSE